MNHWRRPVQPRLLARPGDVRCQCASCGVHRYTALEVSTTTPCPNCGARTLVPLEPLARQSTAA